MTTLSGVTDANIHDGPPPPNLPKNPPHIYIWRARGSANRGGEAPLGAREFSTDWNVVYIAKPTSRAHDDKRSDYDTVESAVRAAFDTALSPGGSIAADIIDIAEMTFTPWHVDQRNTPGNLGLWLSFSTLHVEGI
ncbi:MAG: hypothetical protein AAFV53_28890 [Myxococcota bacterium]